MLVLSCSSLLSTGTPLWSSSCSPTPSWVSLCLKPWVFSAWWLHSLFCLLCKALRLWLCEDMPHCQQHSAVQDAFWMVQWYQLMLPSLFFFLLACLCSLPAHQCMDLWGKPNKCNNSFAVLYILPCLVDKSVTDNGIKKGVKFIVCFWLFQILMLVFMTLWTCRPCSPRSMFKKETLLLTCLSGVMPPDYITLYENIIKTLSKLSVE